MTTLQVSRPVMPATMTFSPGFVLEQTLGHVTHTKNLKSLIGERDDVSARWLDVPYRPDGQLYRLPPVSKNWSLRGSLYARNTLLADPTWRQRDALFVHTLTVGLFATPIYTRVPTVLSVDATPLNLDTLHGAYQHQVQPRPVERVKLMVAQRALRQARAYVAWCDWAKSSLVADYGVDADKVTVLAPGTDVDLFERPERRRKPGPVQILFVGGDFVRKGGDLLLEVFRKRLRGWAQLHLVTGADLPAEEDVFVHHNVGSNSPELVDLYHRADVFALPTRADCLAVVLGEAMAASLPIVTTSVGGHAEAVEDGRSGYVIAPDDVDALGDALEVLVDDRGLRESMATRARELAEERFDARKNAYAILDLMREIA